MKSIIIYGDGELSKMAQQYFAKLGIKVQAIITHLNARQAMIPIRDLQVVVCVCTSPYQPIKEWLHHIGYTDVTNFYEITELYKNIIPINNGWKIDKLFPIDKDCLWYVNNKLTDELSKNHYDAFLDWRINSNEMYDHYDNSNRYFIPEVLSVLHDHEVFVDGGAYHGEVSKKFVDHRNGRYKKVIMFEPDDVSFLSLMNFQYIADKYRYALGDENYVEKFYHNAGYYSQISTLGKGITTVYPLDYFKISATFIKLHLEGGEYNALLGAKNTIAKRRPILAVTCYHKSDGLHQIPRLIMDMCPDYNFYFRLHCYLGQGAVFYAIPKERTK